MTADEFMLQIAYETIQDNEYREKLEYEINLEKSAKKSAKERAQEIKNMFKMFSKK